MMSEAERDELILSTALCMRAVIAALYAQSDNSGMIPIGFGININAADLSTARERLDRAIIAANATITIQVYRSKMETR